MKQISKKIAAWCIQNHPMDDAESHIVAYGIELMLNTSLKVIAIFVIGAAMGYLREVAVAMAVFGGVRYFAGGYHCRTDLGCFSVMLFVCLCPIPFMRMDVDIARWIWGVIVIYSLYEIIRYAPRNSKVNPIYDSLILRKKRVGSIITSVVAVLLIAVYPNDNVRWLVAMPVFVEAVTLSPMFYRRNYEEK